MRRSLSVLAGPLLGCALLAGGVALAAPASAEPHDTRAFGSCKPMNDEYAGGVARTQRAADRAVRQGNLRPIVCPKAYAENRGRLDPNRDGVVCEQPAR